MQGQRKSARSKNGMPAHLEINGLNVCNPYVAGDDGWMGGGYHSFNTFKYWKLDRTVLDIVKCQVIPVQRNVFVSY